MLDNENNLGVAETCIPTTQSGVEDYLLENFVRRNGRFVALQRPTESVASVDLAGVVRRQLSRAYPGVTVAGAVVTAAIRTVTSDSADDVERLLPVWNGAYVCQPGSAERIIPTEVGTVAVNRWRVPAYRAVEQPSEDFGVVFDFLGCLVPESSQRCVLLDWLKFSLQNEAERPTWGLMLYSAERGTGKSTFAKLCRKLFGEENSTTVNGVSTLTQRFNAPVLQHKLVVCEEVNIPAASPQANTLKTLFTDEQIITERKGIDAEPVSLVSNLLFLSNHVPHFLPELDRRLYVIDTSHDGHASGPGAAKFGALISDVNAVLDDEQKLSGLYHHLMRRPISPSFDPRSLNTAVQATPIMRRVLDASGFAGQVVQEVLDERMANAIAARTLEDLGRRFRLRPCELRPQMLQLGWSQVSAKWGGATFSRKVWVRPEYSVGNGRITAPDANTEDLASHLARVAAAA